MFTFQATIFIGLFVFCSELRKDFIWEKNYNWSHVQMRVHDWTTVIWIKVAMKNLGIMLSLDIIAETDREAVKKIN